MLWLVCWLLNLILMHSYLMQLYFIYTQNLEITHDSLVICYNHKVRAGERFPMRRPCGCKAWTSRRCILPSRNTVDFVFFLRRPPLFFLSHRKLVHFVGWIRRGCISEITCRAATRRTRIHFAVLSNDLFFARTWLVLQVSTRAFLHGQMWSRRHFILWCVAWRIHDSFNIWM